MRKLKPRAARDEAGEYRLDGLVDDSARAVYIVQSYAHSCALDEPPIIEFIGEPGFVTSQSSQTSGHNIHASCIAGTWQCTTAHHSLHESLGLGPSGSFALRKVSFEARQIHKRSFYFSLGESTHESVAVLKKDSMQHILKHWKPPLNLLPRNRQSAYAYILENIDEPRALQEKDQHNPISSI